MAHFIDGCRVFTKIRVEGLTSQDFSIANVVATPTGNPNEFSIAVTLSPVQQGGQVSAITGLAVGTGEVQLAHTPGGLANIVPAVSVSGNNVIATFPAVVQATENTGNLWTVTFKDLIVTAVDGQTFTLDSIVRTFTSPF